MKTMKIKYIHNPNTDEETELADTIKDEWNASIMTRQSLGIEEEWIQGTTYYAGEQNPPTDEDDPASNTNVIQPTIESQVSDLVDEDFAITVKGASRSDEMYLEKAKSMLVWTWEQNDMVPKIDTYERNRLKLGTGIWKVRYNPDKGINGLVEYLTLPIESLAVDPKITDFLDIQEADYIIHAKVVSLKYLRRRFGKRAKAVLPEPSAALTTIGLTDDGAVGTSDVISNKAILYERWTKEWDEKEEELYLRLVYMAGDVILWDSETSEPIEGVPQSKGFYRHCLYPFVMVPCYKRDDSVYGMSDSRYLIPIQNIINDLDDQIRYNARLMGNIQVVVGLASGINPNTWTPTPGLRIPARDPNGFKIVQPATIPGYIPERRNQGFNEAELVSGRPDVTEGRNSGGVDAASAIIALQEAGNRRVKHKKKMSAAGFRQLLNIGYEFCLEFYDEEQEFPTKDSDGRDSFNWFKGSELNEIPRLFPDTDEETGYTSGWSPKLDEEGNSKFTKKANFHISINIGQGLPNSHAFIYQSVIELKHADIITREESRTILQKVLGYTGFNPLNPVGAFDGPPNNQFKNSSPYGQPGAPDLGAITGAQPQPGQPGQIGQPQQQPSPEQLQMMAQQQQQQQQQAPQQQDPAQMQQIMAILQQVMQQQGGQQGQGGQQLDPNDPAVQQILAQLIQQGGAQ